MFHHIILPCNCCILIISIKVKKNCSCVTKTNAIKYLQVHIMICFVNAIGNNSLNNKNKIVMNIHITLKVTKDLIQNLSIILNDQNVDYINISFICKSMLTIQMVGILQIMPYYTYHNIPYYYTIPYNKSIKPT